MLSTCRQKAVTLKGWSTNWQSRREMRAFDPLELIEQEDKHQTSAADFIEDDLKVGVADFFPGQDALNHPWRQVPFPFADEEGQ
jgi:hypothetical protein